MILKEGMMSIFSIWPRSRAAIIVTALAVAYVSRPVTAQASGTDIEFEVTLPTATARPPVSKVDIIVDFNEDIPSSAIFTVDDTTAPAVSVSIGPPTALPGGDNVRILKTDLRQVHMIFSVISWMSKDSSGTVNFCQLATGTPPTIKKTFKITTASFTATGYRSASYSAPVLAGASDGSNLFQCTCPVKRVVGYAANFTKAPTKLGTVPMDVYLVLDRSGSMSLTSPGESDNKFGLLQQATGAFIKTWTAYSPGSPSDQLGLVFFSTASEPTAALTPRGNAVTPWQTIADAVQGAHADGLTALGSGLRDAILDLQSKNSDRYIVMMTDGEQNRVPEVLPLTGLDNVKTLDLNPSAPLQGKCIPIYSIGVGLGADEVPRQLINAISSQTAGEVNLTVGSGMFDSFADKLVGLLSGSTLTLVARTEGVLPRNSEEGPAISVPLDSSAQQIIAVVSWSPSLGDVDLEARLTPPGSEGLAVPDLRLPGMASSVQRYTVGPGTWAVRVANHQEIILLGEGRHARAVLQERDIPYRLSIYAIDKTFDYVAALRRPNHSTGRPIELDFDVALNGKGVPGLASAITIGVVRPAGGTGNELHNRQVPADVLAPKTTPDAPSPYLEKIRYLLENDPDFKKAIGPKNDPSVLAVVDKGGGTYAAILPDVNIPGSYEFHTVIEFRDPRNGETIRRMKTLQASVEALADPANSEVKVMQVQGDTRNLVITPRDHFGNYLGPGYGAGIVVKVGDVVQQPATDTREDGTYTTGIQVPAGTNPKVTITVAGTQLGSKPLSEWTYRTCAGCCCFGSSGSSTTPSRVGTLGLTLLVGAVIFRRRRRGW